MGAYSFDTKPFADLIEEDQIGLVTRAFERAIEQSFLADAAMLSRISGSIRKPKMTIAETRRRFEILATWFKTLRADFDFSVARTIDELPIALRKTLNGEVYTPSKRAMWAPNQEDRTCKRSSSG